MCRNTQFREAAQQISRLSIVAVLGVSDFSAAQNQQREDDVLVEEIIVTGTLIRGSSTAGALPISVINRTDLEALGAPTTTDIVNEMVINTGSENRSNALGGQNRNTGTANINLRGLGLDKTLVLFNGKRQGNRSAHRRIYRRQDVDSDLQFRNRLVYDSRPALLRMLILSDFCMLRSHTEV